MEKILFPARVWTVIAAFRYVLRFRAELLALSYAGWMDHAIRM